MNDRVPLNTVFLLLEYIKQNPEILSRTEVSPQPIPQLEVTFAPKEHPPAPNKPYYRQFERKRRPR